MDAAVDENISEACIALAKRFAWGDMLIRIWRTKKRMLTCFVISSCSSGGKVAKMSYFVPIKNGIAVCVKGA
jgi:hypothetical protein